MPCHSVLAASLLPNPAGTLRSSRITGSKEAARRTFSVDHRHRIDSAAMIDWSGYEPVHPVADECEQGGSNDPHQYFEMALFHSNSQEKCTPLVVRVRKSTVKRTLG